MTASTQRLVVALRRRLWTRAGLILLTVSAANIGLWAAFAPYSFYTSWPGFGHAWVAMMPPYNEHLVRDVGDLYLGFTALLAWAVLTLERRLTQVVLVAWLVAALPHTIFHLGHLDGMAPADAIGQTLGLLLTIVVPIAVLVALGWAEPAQASASQCARGGSAA